MMTTNAPLTQMFIMGLLKASNFSARVKSIWTSRAAVANFSFS